MSVHLCLLYGVNREGPHRDFIIDLEIIIDLSLIYILLKTQIDCIFYKSQFFIDLQYRMDSDNDFVLQEIQLHIP